MMEEHYARRLPPEDEDSDDERDRLEMEERMKAFGIEDPSINRKRQSLDIEMIRDNSSSSMSPALSPSYSKHFEGDQLGVLSEVDLHKMERIDSTGGSDFASSREDESVFHEYGLDDNASPELHYKSKFDTPSLESEVISQNNDQGVTSPPPYDKPSTPPNEKAPIPTEESTPSKSVGSHAPHDSTSSLSHGPIPAVPARRRVPPLPGTNSNRNSLDIPASPQTPTI
jgi:hypothetical protein